MAEVTQSSPENLESIFAKPPQNGACLFSTHGGRFQPRYAPHGMPIILRSDPDDDCMQMVADLQHKFPGICRKVKRPVAYTDLYEWFDHRDAHVHGVSFLLSVLSHIGLENQGRLLDYVTRWRTTNAEAFLMVLPGHGIEHLFTPEDIEEYSIEFMTDALMEIKRVQAIEKEEQRVQIQEQHAQMSKDQRVLVAPQISARNSGDFLRAPRATSNPERHPFQFQPDHRRQFPPPHGQLHLPTRHLPLPRLSADTKLLEYITPGSTSRGDFHSDPSDSIARPCPIKFTALPSRGAPGPYSYVHGPAIALDERQRNFSGNMPRSKRNPKKKSSDDARRQFDNEGGHRSMPSHGNTRQYPALNAPMWSSEATQIPHPTVMNLSQVQYVSGPGQYWHTDNHSSRHYPVHIEAGVPRPFEPGPHAKYGRSADPLEVKASRPPNAERPHHEVPKQRHSLRDFNSKQDVQSSVLANMSNIEHPPKQPPFERRQVAGQGQSLEGGSKMDWSYST